MLKFSNIASGAFLEEIVALNIFTPTPSEKLVSLGLTSCPFCSEGSECGVWPLDSYLLR